MRELAGEDGLPALLLGGGVDGRAGVVSVTGGAGTGAFTLMVEVVRRRGRCTIVDGVVVCW